MSTQIPKVGAIAVVLRNGEFLMAQRGKDPGRGLWGFPGGHVEFGETAQAAAVRELREETTVEAAALEYLTCVDVVGQGHHYLIAAVLCAYQSGEPTAMDDAADARWMSLKELKSGKYPLSPDVLRVAELAVERANQRG
ncbi:NUDIX hydrolase [Cognatishimia sp. D5M38]|uniref:NUDIX hydrolase n=1 Tax=Cognatishimia coralii TaxID=3083254 RepID=A0ABU8QKJ7_9RHOB